MPYDYDSRSQDVPTENPKTVNPVPARDALPVKDTTFCMVAMLNLEQDDSSLRSLAAKVNALLASCQRRFKSKTSKEQKWLMHKEVAAPSEIRRLTLHCSDMPRKQGFRF